MLNAPHDWNHVQIMMYGTLFMMAGAYALAHERPCARRRALRQLRPRTQATFDLLLYIVFFLPGIVALTWRLELR